MYLFRVYCVQMGANYKHLWALGLSFKGSEPILYSLVVRPSQIKHNQINRFARRKELMCCIEDILPCKKKKKVLL